MRVSKKKPLDSGRMFDGDAANFHGVSIDSPFNPTKPTVNFCFLLMLGPAMEEREGLGPTMQEREVLGPAMHEAEVLGPATQ